MKLKYYLRGLGVGILVTAVALSLTKETEKLTDAEIKIRAAKLGMVEKSVLADIQKDKDALQDISKDDKDSENKDIKQSDTNLSSENTGNKEIGSSNTNKDIQIENFAEDNKELDNTDEVLKEENKDINSSTEIESEEEIKDDYTKEDDISQSDEKVEKYIVISVTPGNGSELISRKLYEAGLVESAIEYNRFLVANGYAKILRSGEHEIPEGATKEEIAKILCNLD